jgi:hypothetical protein
MRVLIWILIGLALCVFLAGCYTKLVHPTIDTAEYGDRTTRHCSDCHGSADYYYWHYPYYFNWYWGQSHWRSYYYDPWWWYDYWYCCDDDYERFPVERGERHLWEPVQRPDESPRLAPGSGSTGRADDRTPPTGTGGKQKDSEIGKKKEGSERTLWRPVRRPTTPEPKDDKPKAKEKKAEEKRK